MTLTIQDRIEDSLERARWRATNSATGAHVSVSASHEAIADKGEMACLSKAQEKYDGAANAVDVTTGDF